MGSGLTSTLVASAHSPSSSGLPPGNRRRNRGPERLQLATQREPDLVPSSPPPCLPAAAGHLCDSCFLGLWGAPGEGRTGPCLQKPGLENASGVPSAGNGPKPHSREGLSARPVPERGSGQESAALACPSQRDRSQWLMAGSAGVSAASSPVGLSLAATSWYLYL